jgi:hypothetical protein
MYAYFEAVRPPSGPWALRSPNSRSRMSFPAAMRNLQNIVFIEN